MIAAWALGITGICLGDSHGIRVGKTAAKVAVMRVSEEKGRRSEGEVKGNEGK